MKPIGFLFKLTCALVLPVFCLGAMLPTGDLMKKEQGESTDTTINLVFQVFDKDRDELLSESEAMKLLSDRLIGNLVAKRVSSLDEDERADLVSSLDIDGDGRLSKEEVRTSIVQTRSESSPQTRALDLAFESYDKDKDGFLSREEFLSGMGSYGVTALQSNTQGTVPIGQPVQIPKSEMSKHFGRLDQDGDGSLSVEEFSNDDVPFVFDPPLQLTDSDLSQEQRLGMMKAQLAMFFSEWDEDDDNFLSEVEFDAIGMANADREDVKSNVGFDMLDLNEDERISQDELTDWFQSIVEELLPTNQRDDSEQSE